MTPDRNSTGGFELVDSEGSAKVPIITDRDGTIYVYVAAVAFDRSEYGDVLIRLRHIELGLKAAKKKTAEEVCEYISSSLATFCKPCKQSAVP